MDHSQFDQLLSAAVKAGASDIHLKSGSPPMVREGNNLVPVSESAIAPDEMLAFCRRILQPVAGRSAHAPDLEDLASITDFDAPFSLPGVGRFRVNICRQRGTLAVVMRAISFDVPNIDTLKLPPVIKEIALESRGLILVTGTTGSGKSTTLAAMIGYVNDNAGRKIITIEDPIEYLIPDKASSIMQREVGTDTASFAAALRAAMRQDTDIIMVGELRDRESIDIALKAAETGHLVLSTVHTPDVEGSIDRLIGVYTPPEHPAVRIQICDCLRAVISQRLVPLKDSEGRIAAVEVMRMTVAIRERIQTADPKGFYDLIEQGGNPWHMQTFDQHLTELYKKGLISLETALAAATSPVNLKRNLQFD